MWADFKGISRFLNLPTFLLYGFASGDLRASQLTPACQLRAFAVQWETYVGISASEIHHFHSCQIVLNVVLSCIILYHIMYSVVYSICVWYLLIVYYCIVLYEIIVCHQIAFQYCIAQCYLNSVQLYHVHCMICFYITIHCICIMFSFSSIIWYYMNVCMCIIIDIVQYSIVRTLYILFRHVLMFFVVVWCIILYILLLYIQFFGNVYTHILHVFIFWYYSPFLCFLFHILIL